MQPTLAPLSELDTSAIIWGGGIGGGGKGGAGGGGSEAPNTLRSLSILNIVLLLGEGEIYGFPPGEDIRKYIYLDETAIVAADGTVNHKGVSVDFRSGTQSQSVIPGADQGVETPIAVGVNVLQNNGPITRSLTNPNATAIRIVLQTPGLRSADNEGNINGSSVEFKIWLSSNGGPFILKTTDKFEGKTSGAYARSYTIKTTGAGPWQVRVERVTLDSSSDKVQNILQWSTVSSIVEQKFSYPNSALLYVRLDASYFSQLPKISIRLKWMICRVPSNYDPIARTYTGIWNGTWARKWTNNPAWVLMELLTNTRFGTGRYISVDQLDKMSLYKIAQYNDQMLPDENGVMRPRYTFNAYIREPQEAYQLIESIRASMQVMAYYHGGQMVFVQDAPGQPVGDIFCDANVVVGYDNEGRMNQPPFTYERTSLQARHAVCLIRWQDNNEFGRQVTSYTDLAQLGYPDDMIKYGYRSLELAPLGCTSLAQALRYGAWALLTEKLESEMVKFSVGSQGLLELPGAIVKVQDNHRSSEQLGGRIESATTTTVTLDREVAIANTSTNLLMLIDGTEVSRLVISLIGTHTTLSLFPALTALPAAGSIWLLSGPQPPTEYRLLAAAENRDDHTYGIIASEYSRSKYAAIDSALLPQMTSSNNQKPVAPTNLEIIPTATGYLIGWKESVSTNANTYILEFQEIGSNTWHPIPMLPGYTDRDWSPPTTGLFNFRVAAIDLAGRRSDWLYKESGGRTIGYVKNWYPDGSIGLDQFITLAPATTYWLRTLNATSDGSVYQSRQIITPPGTVSRVNVTPSFLGATSTTVNGNSSTLPFNNINYVLFTAPSIFSNIVYSVVLFSQANSQGTSIARSVGAGSSLALRASDLAPLGGVVGSIEAYDANGDPTAAISAIISPSTPAQSPVPGSTWELLTQP